VRLGSLAWDDWVAPIVRWRDTSITMRVCKGGMSRRCSQSHSLVTGGSSRRFRRGFGMHAHVVTASVGRIHERLPRCCRIAFTQLNDPVDRHICRRGKERALPTTSAVCSCWINKTSGRGFGGAATSVAACDSCFAGDARERSTVTSCPTRSDLYVEDIDRLGQSRLPYGGQRLLLRTPYS
jgi:hypothetical protein